MAPSPVANRPASRDEDARTVTLAPRTARLRGDDEVDGEARLPWLRLPAGTAGLLIRRQSGPGGGGWEGPVACHVPDAAAVEFHAVRPGGLWPAAVAMSLLPQVRHVVICPLNGAPSRAALAFAVGDLLPRPSRRVLSATVVCGSELPAGAGLSVVRHEVRLNAPSGCSDWVVWQFLAAGPVGGRGRRGTREAEVR